MKNNEKDKSEVSGIYILKLTCDLVSRLWRLFPLSQFQILKIGYLIDKN